MLQDAPPMDTIQLILPLSTVSIAIRNVKHVLGQQMKIALPASQPTILQKTRGVVKTLVIPLAITRLKHQSSHASIVIVFVELVMGEL